MESRDSSICSLVKWAALVTWAHKVHWALQLACFCLPFPLSSIGSGASLPLLSNRPSSLHHCSAPPLHLLIRPSSSAFITLGLQEILETSPQRQPPPHPKLPIFCGLVLRKSSVFRVPYFMPCPIHFLHSCSLSPCHHYTEAVSRFQSHWMLCSGVSFYPEPVLLQTPSSTTLATVASLSHCFSLLFEFLPTPPSSCCSSNTAHLPVLPSACLFTPSHSLGLSHAYTKESVLIYDSMFRDFVCTVTSAYATNIRQRFQLSLLTVG